jgi:DNA-binding protein HU-beta
MHFFCQKYLVYKDFLVILPTYFGTELIIHFINITKTTKVMNKSDLIKAAAAKAEVSAALAAKVIDAALEEAVAAVKKGEKINLVGYATIAVAQKAARKGINPLTKQAINIPARKVVRIKPGAKFAL